MQGIIHRWNAKSGQGTVEFALVLPILLLLVLGIIAFGHLFFVYSSVVSASREAARYGSAVGLVESGSSLERFRACDKIRAEAVRMGTFAGIAPENIDIRYDQGPGSALLGTCPIGAEGPDVKLGDRITVDITIQYKSIVPFVPIPEIPLQATTARTIIRSLTVGAGPTAESLCPFTDISITSNPETSVIGEPVFYTIAVSSEDGTIPANTDSIILLDEESNTGCNNLDAPSDTCGPFSYLTTGEKKVVAAYDGSTFSPCYEPVEGSYTHNVAKANSIIEITADLPDPSPVNTFFTVTVRVQAAAPGSGIPTGSVEIYDIDRRYSCTAVLDSAGYASCDIRPQLFGLMYLRAEYLGDSSYNPNTTVNDEAHLVFDPRTPTPLPTNTLISTPTLVSQPEKTPLPSWCPSWSPRSINFNTQDSALLFGLSNANGNSKTEIASIEIAWPELPTARLTEIRFGTSTASCNTTGNDRNCLWRDTSGLPPTYQVISPSTPGWDKQSEDLAKGATKEMRLVFDHPLPVGDYSLVVRFTNNCVLDDIQGYRP
jgi:hypothetical protein